MATAPAYALPPEAFREDRWFAAEQRWIFGAHWNFVAHASALEAPGSFRVVQVGLDSLIVVRDQRGVRGRRLRAGAGL